MEQRGLDDECVMLDMCSGGVVSHHGGIDGKPGKVNVLIPPEDGFAEDGGGDFGSVCIGAL
jgi:hypothetical protein